MPSRNRKLTSIINSLQISLKGKAGAFKRRLLPRRQTKQSTSGNPASDTSKIPYLGENVLRQLTKRPIWDWDSFRAVLICLAQRGQGYYLPSHSRPNSIFLDGLQTTFGELRQISDQWKGRETSRIVFVDTDRSCLVISGKTHIGSLDKVKIDTTSEPGRKYVQLPVLSIHVHPGRGDNTGLSDQDYISFLTDRRMIIMVVCFKDGNLFAMKTSSTPTVISPDSARHRIAIIRTDIQRVWSSIFMPKSILAFNKAVCIEFGLTLYLTEDPGGNVARRIEVTNA